MSATDVDGDGDANLELLAEAERESDVVGGAVERPRDPARDVAGVVEVGEVACAMAQCRLRVVAPLTRASAVPGRHTVTAHVRRPARAARLHRPTERRVHEVRTTSPRRCTHHTHTHPCNGPLSGTTPRVSRYPKGKTNLDFTGARDSEWQWHQLSHMQVWYGMVNVDLYSAIITKVSNAQVCTSLQSDNHASTPPLSF